MKWENTTNEEVLKEARAEILQAWGETCELNKDHPQAKELFDAEKMPALHDPFAGGGTIPLEAQRAGLEAHASDRNPVAVLINKAMIEIPPKFADRPPVHPDARSPLATWKGAAGLAEDVRRYGKWMRDEAFKRIGHLYPPVEATEAMVRERPDLKTYEGEKLTVIAWLWARTVKSPNPVFSHVDVPLASTFILSSKQGKEADVQPVVDKAGYTFTVKVGKPPVEVKAGTSAGKWQAFRCVMSGIPISYEYIRGEGTAGRMGSRLMAVVVEGSKSRVYLSPHQDYERAAVQARPLWFPDLEINHHPRDIKTQIYGLKTYGDLFTPRQLVALTTFCDLIGEARERIRKDALAAALFDHGRGLDAGGTGADAYADAVTVYLGMGVSKLADYSSTIVVWSPTRDQLKTTFSRQALPMTWDYAETNLFAEAAGDLSVTLEGMSRTIDSLGSSLPGAAYQVAAQTQNLSACRFVSTDPPYYDNIGYADLSDFFYVWQRRSLRPVFPGTLATISVPKSEELVAIPYRDGTKQKAEAFFLEGMTRAMHNLAAQAHPSAPITI